MTGRSDIETGFHSDREAVQASSDADPSEIDVSPTSYTHLDQELELFDIST